MSNDVLIGLVIAALILAAGRLLVTADRDRRAAMSRKQRAHEDAQHDSDQIW